MSGLMIESNIVEPNKRLLALNYYINTEAY
jgi:hypothetical protein